MLSAVTDWGVSFVLGLASTPHCAAMCGPLVIACSAGCAPGRTAPHLAYQAGRIFTYTLLGALAGWFGQGAFWLGHLAGLERGIAIAAGLILVLSGLIMLGLQRGPEALVQLTASTSRGWLRRLGPVLRRADAPSRLWLGMGLGLLPCGLVWAALAKSLASGNAWSGAVSMAGFGAGTAIPLLAISLAAGGWTRRFAAYGTRLAAVGLVALGLVTTWRGLHPAIGVQGNACHHVPQRAAY